MRKYQFKIALMLLLVVVGMGLYAPTLIESQTAKKIDFQLNEQTLLNKLSVTEKIANYRDMDNTMSHLVSQNYGYDNPNKWFQEFFAESVSKVLVQLVESGPVEKDDITILNVSVTSLPIPGSNQGHTIWQVSFTYRDVQGTIAIDDALDIPLYIGISSSKRNLLDPDTAVANIMSYLNVQYELESEDTYGQTYTVDDIEIRVSAYRSYFEFNGKMPTGIE